MAVTGMLRETVIRPAGETPAREAGDGDLLARAAAGDRSAFRALHGRYEAYVHWLALRLLGERRDAEDAVQEAWLSVHRRARQLRRTDRFRGWLRSIVVRCCLDQRRRRRPPYDPPPEVEAALAAHPAERIDLEGALRALPEEQRVVVTLHDVEGLAHGEIGELVGITEEASRQRLSRGRRALRRRLEEP